MADFGQFRGFGDKLFQGKLPTQLGLIGSLSIGFDIDAVAFFARVTTAGGTLSDTEQNAVNQLVIDMKDAGIWTKMKAIYPMVGASAAACSRNLKSDDFNGTFNGGLTFASSGVKPNGTNAYMNTGITPITDLLVNSIHFSNYFPNLVSEGAIQIGVSDAGPPNKATYAAYNYPSIGAIINVNSSSNVFFEDQTSDSGFRIVSRTSASLTKSFVNNTEIYSSSQTSTERSSFNIVLFARNTANTIGDLSSNEQSFCSIGDGLTDSEAGLFYTAVQAFQTTLNRDV
jgi:hypothetical protein